LSAIYLHNVALARLTHACASSADALNFGSDFKDVKNEARNAAHAADLAKPPEKMTHDESKICNFERPVFSRRLACPPKPRGDGWATQNQRVGGIGPALPQGSDYSQQRVFTFSF